MSTAELPIGACERASRPAPIGPAGSAERRRFAQAFAVCAGPWGLANLAAWTLPSSAWAQTNPVDGSVQGWIDRVRAAGTSTSFQGTFVVTAEGSASSSRIVHFSVGRDSYERVEALDGPPRRQYRHNEVVQTVWPQARLVVVEPRAATASFPSLPDPGAGTPSGSKAIDAWYEVSRHADGRVAGREASVLTLAPRDRIRFAHRLWVDRQTQLLLRADVLGHRGDVLESTAFSDLTVGIRPQPALVLEGMAPPAAPWRVVKASLQGSSLEQEGWRWDATAPGVAGFRLVSCVRRPMQMPPVESPAAAHAVQSTFSDGLAIVSVFAEEHGSSRHTRELTQQIGATHTLTRRVHNAWITVVGDIPAMTAQRFADAFTRRTS
jgi:sigma-E factor negative regulatory protein RseB